MLSENMINVTGPDHEGIDLIYTKYTCSYYGIYLLFYMCYAKSVNFVEFLMDFGISDDILVTVLIIDKKLLHFKPSQLGQILCVNTGFSQAQSQIQVYHSSITISLHCHFNSKVRSH